MVATENTELREQIKKMEYEKVEMRHNLIALKEAHDPKAALNAGDMENPDMKRTKTGKPPSGLTKSKSAR